MEMLGLEMNNMDETKVIFSKKNLLKQNGYTNGDVENHNHEEWEKEYYSDEEEDVFMDIGGINMDKASSKPLMHPRHRTKVKSRTPDCKCRKHFRPILCFLILVLSLGSLMGIIIYVYNKKEAEYVIINRPEVEQTTTSSVKTENEVIEGCDEITVEDVWVQGFPKLITESSLRLVDVNEDGVLDVILGFGTGADGYYLPNIVCDIYFNGTYPCFGGLLALEGKTGKELWRHYSPHELFGVNCNADLNKDGVKDCLAGGRANAFQAVNGKNGRLLWNFAFENDASEIMNLYTPQIIRDLDGDGVEDILAVHGGDPLQPPDSKYRLSARIILFSGRTGSIIKRMSVPDYHESYYSPQIYTLPDGTDVVLYGTGGETHTGSLWSVTLENLYRGKIENSRKIYTDDYKGIMTPPVLLDLNGDGVEDILMAMFNSTVMAIDGYNYNYLWNASFPMSESYNTPSPGFYNDDDVPDFMVKYAHGPGFPIYYSSQTTILDGRNGQQLLKEPIRDIVGAQSSPLTISMEGKGNDIFLYWTSDCHSSKETGGEYKFVKGTNVHEQSRSDFCRLRFKSKGYSKLYALSRHLPSPGTTVYYSSDRRDVEHSHWTNTTKEAIDYVNSHPEVYEDYLNFKEISRKAEMERPENKYGKLEIPIDVPSGEMPYDEPTDYNEQRVSSKKGHPMNTDYSVPPRNRMRQPADSYQTGRIQERPRIRQPVKTDQTESLLGPSQYQSYGNVLQNVIGNGYGVDKVPGSLYPQNNYDDNYSNTVSYPNYRPRNRNRNRDGLAQASRRRPRPQMVKKEFMRLVKRDIPSEMNVNELKNRTYNLKIQKSKTNEFVKDVYRNKDKLKKHKNKKHKTEPSHRKRKRRHIGPHDEEGLQRLLSTGTLAPTTLQQDHPDFNHSIDVMFATYWFFPAKTQVILKEDQDCIDKKMDSEKQRFGESNKYYGMDHDKYEHVVTQECLQRHGTDEHDTGHTFQSMTTFNPYNLHMGQMTVYRLRLTCRCKSKSKRCSRVLPFNKQQWTAYMGRNGDSHWLPRKH